MQAIRPKTNYLPDSAKGIFHEISKNGRPTKRPMTGHKGTPACNSPNTWAEKDFSFDKIVISDITIGTLKADFEKFKSSSITIYFGKQVNVT